MTNMFTLTVYDTKKDDKFFAEPWQRYQVIGDKESIFHLWFTLSEIGIKHLEIRDLFGNLQNPKQGLNGLTRVNI